MSKNTAEPNAQNSEHDPASHPSGARIEKMYKNASEAREKRERNEGTAKDPLDDPAEGSKGSSETTPHRMDPDHRERR